MKRKRFRQKIVKCKVIDKIIIIIIKEERSKKEDRQELKQK